MASPPRLSAVSTALQRMKGLIRAPKSSPQEAPIPKIGPKGPYVVPDVGWFLEGSCVLIV